MGGVEIHASISYNSQRWPEGPDSVRRVPISLDQARKQHRPVSVCRCPRKAGVIVVLRRESIGEHQDAQLGQALLDGIGSKELSSTLMGLVLAIPPSAGIAFYDSSMERCQSGCLLGPENLAYQRISSIGGGRHG